MKIKILIVAPNLRISNGVTTFLMNHYPYVLKNDMEMDFLLLYDVDSPYLEYVKKCGSKVFLYPEKNKYSIKNYIYAKNVLINNKYDIIHCNTSGMFAYWILLAADKLGVKGRIYHSHNPKERTSLKGIVREEVFDFLCFKHTNYYMACTKHAGESVFGKHNYHVINNGIDFKKFSYDEQSRAILRKEIDIEEKIVLGTVCRQADQKNPLFICDVINELRKLDERYVLIWIGTGPMMQETKKYLLEIGANQNVLFLGDRDNIDKYYSAMDVFLLPSKYEGLGIVYMEAQANGLLCYASDAVPLDTNITNNIKYLPLHENAKYWAKIINDDIRNKNKYSRIVDSELLLKSSYNVQNSSKALVAQYNHIYGG